MGKDLKGKELGEGLSQRKNGSYCGRYVDKTGKRKSLYNKDLRVLKKELNKAIYECENNLSLVDKNISLNQWFEQWMQVYKNEVIRPNTKRNYIHVFKHHISPHLGVFPICEITKIQITNLLNKLKANGYMWETQNKVRILLIDMFNRALEDNFVNRNPAKGVRLPSNKPSNDVRVLTKEEQSIFFDCSSGTFYNNLFVVAVNTGLRPGELFALTWDKIDLKNKIIKVDHTLVYQKYEEDDCKEFHLEEPKTKTSKRTVPINSICELALKRQYVQKNIIAKRNIKKTKFEDLLFTTKYNTPLNSVLYSNAIQSIINETNLILDDLEQIENFSGHVFRHTFATRCIENGVRPKTLQAILGHASLQMTMDLYVHVTDDTMHDQINLIIENDSENIVNENVENKFDDLMKNNQKVVSIDGVRLA